jgi:hypothetical protein
MNTNPSLNEVKAAVDKLLKDVPHGTYTIEAPKIKSKIYTTTVVLN